MSVQQLDLIASLSGKDRGTALALSPETLDEWRERFRRAVEALARDGRTFTSEDVVDLVGLPAGEHGTNRNNAVGAMMNGLARRGVIRKTDRRVPSARPSSHGAELIVWAGAS